MFWHLTPKNVVPSHTPPKFVTNTQNILPCHASSQKIILLPHPTAPQLPPPPPQRYVLGSVSTFMCDLPALKHLCMEKCAKNHQNSFIMVVCTIFFLKFTQSFFVQNTIKKFLMDNDYKPIYRPVRSEFLQGVTQEAQNQWHINSTMDIIYQLILFQFLLF